MSNRKENKLTMNLFRLRNNLSDIVTEELNVCKFTISEEQPVSIENLINDCEGKDNSKEMFIPEICSNDQEENEEIVGINLPEPYVQDERLQVVEMVSETNTHLEET
jgi:hypothetical protein